VFALSLRSTARVLGTTAGAVLRRGTAALLAAQAMGVLVFGVRLGLYRVLPPRIYVVGGLSMAAATLVFLVALPVGIASYSLILRLVDRELFDGFWRNFGMAFRRNGAARTPEDL
jgi:hypothetical protein